LGEVEGKSNGGRSFGEEELEKDVENEIEFCFIGMIV
jgi:hypothetical protein